MRKELVIQCRDMRGGDADGWARLKGYGYSYMSQSMERKEVKMGVLGGCYTTAGWMEP